MTAQLSTLNSQPALSEDPLTWPVLQEICLATKAGVLHNIRLYVIPEIPGITREQRKQLDDAVSNRFAQLNAAHPAINRKPRWS